MSAGIWVAWVLAAGLAALAGGLPPDGRDHAAFAQFLGRFHPLVLHLPIALFLLVLVFEWLGREEPRSHLRPAAGWVLGLATATALAAAYDGWLLAWSGGYKSALVTRHMWGGILFALASTLALTLRRRGSMPYQAALAAGFCLLVWASHNGGALSHGEGFLTEYMPDGLRRLLHIPRSALPPPTGSPAVPAAKTLYLVKIQPILDHSCVQCHGPDKVKGGLRLDSYAYLMKGGKTGAEIDPWRPDDSDLYRRITLPPDDDDFMPSNGKNLLTAEQKQLIKNWILAGASDRQPVP